MGRPTEKMINKLAEFGIDASAWDFVLAKETIGAIANNQWQLPARLAHLATESSERNSRRELKPGKKPKKKSRTKKQAAPPEYKTNFDVVADAALNAPWEDELPPEGIYTPPGP